MSKSWFCVVVLGCLVAVAAAAQTDQSPAEPELRWDQVDRADGKTLYMNLCASCHGAGGRGDGPMAEVLEVGIPDLTTLTERNDGEFPLAWVEETIHGPKTLEIHGGPQMPVWGPALMGLLDGLPHVNREAFAQNRIRKITRHIESLQRTDG